MTRVGFSVFQWIACFFAALMMMVLIGCKHTGATTHLQPLPYPVKVQYDWIAVEDDFPFSGHTHKLKTCEEDFLIRLDANFAAAIKASGAGKLTDGRVIGTSHNCECGLGYNCFEFMDGDHPWGLVTRGRTKNLYTSASASSLPLGTILYIPSLDGLNLPDTKTKHNGYVKVDSRNYFAHNQVNLFVGTQDIANKLSYILNDAVKVEVCNEPECRERILQF